MEETIEVPVVPEQPVVEAPTEDIEEVKAKLAKAEENYENQRIRAEKAEREAKKPAESIYKGVLTSGDLLAVTNAKVHEDDIEKVERYAKSEGLSIKDALHAPELKAMLEVRAEQRQVAEATNITNVRRGSVDLSDEALIANARGGKIPDSDLEIERLVAAQTRRR